VPPYPVASTSETPARRLRNAALGRKTQTVRDLNGSKRDAAALREEIRRLILEESARLAGG